MIVALRVRQEIASLGYELGFAYLIIFTIRSEGSHLT